MTRVSDVYPDKWIRASDLNGKQVAVVIAQVAVEELRQMDGSNRKKVVLVFVGAHKRLPLNKTQALAVAEIAGTDVIEQWPGLRIVLGPSKAKNGKPTIAILRSVDEYENTDRTNQRRDDPSHGHGGSATATKHQRTETDLRSRQNPG